MSFEHEENFDYYEETVSGGSWSSRCLREIKRMDEAIAMLDRQLAKLKSMAFELDNGPLLRSITPDHE